MSDLENRLAEQTPYFSGKYCPNSRQILRIAINLKNLIDKVINVQYDESEVLKEGSIILNDRVIDLALRAAGGKGDGQDGTSSYKYRAVLPFCLLKVTQWYWELSETELSDNGLYSLRATVAQTIAARIIEGEKRDQYLFLGMLCHRYTISCHEEDSAPVSALELAVDMHSTIVISTSGYQRCMKWLWRGWIVQSSTDPHSYVYYKNVASQSISAHFDPDRIKTPLYQNILEVLFTVIYIILYTLVLNLTVESMSHLTAVEYLFYAFTFGFVLSEVLKFYHVGWSYLGFWSVLSDFTYSIILVSIGFRLASINVDHHDHHEALEFYQISYRVLACAAPFMWTRLLLFLDAQQFVGAMIVVIKNMMQESIIFFVLLFVVLIGFLQGFLGLDMADGRSDKTKEIFISLVQGVIGGDLNLEGLAPGYASVLQYIYIFLITVILMNILVALYSTSYSKITESATDEYFALVAQKTLRYIRAPDEDLYVPPLNLVEVVISPLSWVISKTSYRAINRVLMLALYSPFLSYTTVYELGNARRIIYNRYKGLPDDANELDVEWDLTDGFSASSGDAMDGIREQNTEVARAVAEQREGEDQDPEFSIDQIQFHKEIDEVVQPVQKASIEGIPWEFYSLYKKVDHLTELVEKLILENGELKQKMDK